MPTGELGRDIGKLCGQVAQGVVVLPHGYPHPFCHQLLAGEGLLNLCGRLNGGGAQPGKLLTHVAELFIEFRGVNVKINDQITHWLGHSALLLAGFLRSPLVVHHQVRDFLPRPWV